jgi:hypothetical protein
MRYDMDKVIVERPRVGRGQAFPRPQFRADDDRLPVRQPMKRPWQVQRREKELNENLRPLFRYLESNLGRPWDKVYSEIRQRISPNSAVQMHIWQHVTDYVCLSAEEIRTPRGVRFVRLDQPGRLWHTPFVVHPRTGLLVRDPEYWDRRRRPVRARPKAVRREGRVLMLIAGIWYELTLRPVQGTSAEEAFDFVARDTLARVPRTLREQLYGDGNVYAAEKRQLSKKEIRLLDLRK